MATTVPLVDLQAQYHGIRSRVLEEIARVFEEGSFILGPAVVGWLETPDALSFSAGAGLAGQPDALQGFLVMLGYTVILSGLAFWIVQRRDIAGAKGE